MTTPTPAPSGAKASPSEEVIQLLYRWRTMDEPSLTPIQRECVLALAIDAHTARITAERDAARAEAATLRAEVDVSREFIDKRGGYEEHCGHLTPDSKKTCPMIGCRISAARAAVDALPQPREVKE